MESHLDEISPPVDGNVSAKIRIRVLVRGVVQGVGFRPTVFRLAHEEQVTGWVSNSADGAIIEAEGPRAAVHQFLERVIEDAPSLSKISGVDRTSVPTTGDSSFEIRSSVSGKPHVWVLPDIATCDDCLREIRDPADRRFGYPFANCTLCGPRFSIIQALPYDRVNTTMSAFHQCPDCQQEYADPRNRRFHAQPNACPACGPSVWLVDSAGAKMCERETSLEECARLIRGGGIVAVKGLGGFHLVTLAGSLEAVVRLRQRKQREEKPLAIMCADLAMAEQLGQIGRLATDTLSSPQAPIVLVPRSESPDQWGVVTNPSLAPGACRLGLMLAYTPLHHVLLEKVGQPVVATSGNVTDEPICTQNDEAIARLQGIADAFLLHDRLIERAVDDSVVQIVSGSIQVLRRSRGYAPLPVELASTLHDRADREPQNGNSQKTVLAVGAHQKDVVTLLHGTDAFQSQHIGDLDTLAAIQSFEQSLKDLPDLYDAAPDVIARDMHPDYASSMSTVSSRTPAFEIQHHVAHVLSCMAEHQTDTTVLGISWDGTGLGIDGSIWGGEAFVIEPPESTASTSEPVQRVASLRPFRLVGGDRASRQPRRSALGLWDALGRPAGAEESVRTLFSNSEWDSLRIALDSGLATHTTSSVGRLFDGLSALITGLSKVRYEAQAAIALEELAWTATRPGGFDVETSAHQVPQLEIDDDGLARINWAGLFDVAVDNALQPADKALIIHISLARAVAEIAELYPRVPVVLTGGCFQNRLLTELSSSLLAEVGREVLIHRSVPPNDGGISLGQAVAARWFGASRPSQFVRQVTRR